MVIGINRILITRRYDKNVYHYVQKHTGFPRGGSVLARGPEDDNAIQIIHASQSLAICSLIYCKHNIRALSIRC